MQPRPTLGLLYLAESHIEAPEIHIAFTCAVGAFRTAGSACAGAGSDWQGGRAEGRPATHASLHPGGGARGGLRGRLVHRHRRHRFQVCAVADGAGRSTWGRLPGTYPAPLRFRN